MNKLGNNESYNNFNKSEVGLCTTDFAVSHNSRLSLNKLT